MEKRADVREIVKKWIGSGDLFVVGNGKEKKRAAIKPLVFRLSRGTCY